MEAVAGVYTVSFRGGFFKNLAPSGTTQRGEVNRLGCRIDKVDIPLREGDGNTLLVKA